MDILIKLMAGLFALLILLKPRKVFCGPWNISEETYRASRAGLYLFYVGSLVVFFGICVASDNPWREFFEDNEKILKTTAVLSALTTVCVSAALGIDVNYRISRRLGYERNRFKHWLFQGSAVMPMAFCGLMNKLLIPVMVVVYFSTLFVSSSRLQTN